MPATGLELTTPRLILQPIRPHDTALLHRLWSTPGVRRFLWDDEAIPMSRTQAAIEQSEELFRSRRVGLWGAWMSPGSSMLAGFGGLWPFRDPPEMELLYGVAERWWGRGYATEIAHAVTTYCFVSLAMPAVRASTDIGNAASIRVLEKTGFGLLRRAEVGGLDTVFYELARAPARPSRAE